MLMRMVQRSLFPIFVITAYGLFGGCTGNLDDAGHDLFDAATSEQTTHVPDAGPEPDAAPDAGPEPDAPPDAGPEPEPTPDAGPEPEPEPIPDAGPEPEPEPIPDAGPEPEPEPVLGTFDAPIVVDDFPFTYAGDTTFAPSDAGDTYAPCAPGTPELGGGYVFLLHIPAGGPADQQLTITVDDVPGDDVDIDLHLLSAPDPATCFDRHNTTLGVAVAPGETLYLVADTWTNGAGEDLAGPFTLTMSLQEISVGSCFENPIPTCDESSFPLVNGVPTEAAGVGGCPAGMTPVTDFCVDRYEAMLVEVLPGGTLAPHSPYQNPGNKTVRALSVAGVQPQGYISGDQAGAACAQAGKRLCSDNEWLRACKGANNTTYPYGNSVQPGVCNDARACHPAMQYFETNANWVFSNLNHNCINQLPASLDDTGQNAGCVSDDGAYDMMGNLHEWTADPTGHFRGGFYVDTVNNNPGCNYLTTAHTTPYWDYSTGFRCCADLP